MRPRKTGYYVAFLRGVTSPEVVQVEFSVEVGPVVWRCGIQKPFGLCDFIFERRLKI